MKWHSMAVACVLLVSALARADPPPFGTLLQRWELQMSGSYAGSGVTWRRDEGRFYLMDQGYAGEIRVWKLDPADPTGTIVQVPWTFSDLGTSTEDIPWAMAWDNDSGCFWISNIVDGDIYGGCYLMRYVWDGSSWVWGHTPRDSWRMGSDEETSGIYMLWLAAVTKWHDKGCFLCPHLTKSASRANFSKVDPYTRSHLGIIRTTPPRRSARGCCIIPDSNYSVAFHWDSGLVKLDSVGRLLYEDPGAEGAADLDVLVPEFPSRVPDDTVCFYVIRSSSSNYFDRVSAGMLWSQVPGWKWTVFPTAILVPETGVDSGAVVAPRVVVRNAYLEPLDSVDVHFMVRDRTDRVFYHDSTCILGMGSMAADTVEFAPWIVNGRDSVTATCRTFWRGDSLPGDDTISKRFCVRVLDVGITDVENPVPCDTIDPDTVYPGCVLWNHGNVTTTVPVVFNIGPYWDTVQVHNLIAGGSRAAIAERPWVASSGRWQCLMKAEVIGDLHPDNNDTGFVFFVRGDIDHDVEVSSIDAPVVLVDTLPFVPLATVRNNCSSTEQFCTLFWIEDTLTETRVYFDTIPVWLPGGQQVALAFRPCTLKVEGQYVASCSAHVVTDQNWLNNAIHADFLVGSGSGIREQHKQKLAAEVPEPTVVRGMLRIGDGRRETVDRADLLDIAGRKVAVLQPGVNDVRHLAPGIYYLRLVAGGDAACRKLVKLE
jgi:hypothetical protein